MEKLRNMYTATESETVPLNRWLYQTIRPFIKGKVLEVGSRTGNLAQFFIDDNIPLRLSDPDRDYSQRLKSRFEGNALVRAIHQVDPSKEEFNTQYAPYFDKFDTVLMINPIESILANPLTLANIKQFVREGGHWIVRVPARIALFEYSADGVEYWKRLTRHSLQQQLGKNIEFVQTIFFNVIDPSQPSPRTAPLGDQPIPEFEVEGDLRPLGLSVIAVARIKEKSNDL